MSFSPTSGQVVLKEVFDEGSVPTDEEIHDYALRIGIDVENEPHLLYLARDGLMQALPSGWKPCYDKDKKEIYYFNFKTKRAQWEHPLDDFYRNLVKKARNESILSEQVDDDSRTSLKEDLKSYEEASLILTANEMYSKPKKLEPLNPLGKSILKKIPPALSPIKKSNSKDLLKSGILKPALFIDEEKLLQKSENYPLKRAVFDETEVRKRPNSSDIRNRRNIGPMEFRHLSKQEIITPNALEKLNFLTETKKLMDNKIYTDNPSKVSPSEIKGSESGIVTKDEGYGTEFSVSSLGEKDSGKKELTLAGGGSVFLKNNKTKFSPSSELVTSSFSKEELSEGLLSPDARKSGHDFDSQPKSILREQNNQKVNEKASFVAGEKKLGKDDSEEERKSVRFNLEKELKISFEIPWASTRDESESGSTSEEKNKCDNLSLGAREKQEARQIEIDFDDLEICLSDEKLEKSEKEEEEEKVPIDSVKTAEPKKFKLSQLLVKEFRDVFENQPKNVNFLEGSKFANAKSATVKSSRISSSSSSSSRSTTSQSEDNPSHSQENNFCVKEKEEDDEEKEIKIDQSENLVDSKKIKDSKELKSNEEKKNSAAFDSTFADLVDFAIKKKLDIIPSGDENSNGKIHYPERDFLLEEILKENESDSEEESEGEKQLDKEMEYLEKLESQIGLKARRRREDLGVEMAAVGNSEKFKNEKLNELESSHETWLKKAEESYGRKKLEATNELRERYEEWMRGQETEFEKTYREKYEKERENRMKELKSEFTKREISEMEKLKDQLNLERKERVKKLKMELEAEELKELDSLRKSFEDGLNEKKAELMRKHREEMNKVERNLEDLLSEQKSQKLKELEMARENEAAIEAMRLEMKEIYQKQKSNLMKEHELLLKNMKEEHDLVVEQLKIEFKNEEESIRKTQLKRLEEIKTRMEVAEGKKNSENVEISRAENAEARVFEKVRCEKRLLEDKYKTLKEKYIRLKAEAKFSQEKKKKESYSATTGSETERSFSYVTSPGVGKSDSDDPNSSRKKQQHQQQHQHQQQQQQKKGKKLKKETNHLECSSRGVSSEEEEENPKNFSRPPQKNSVISDSKKKQRIRSEEKGTKSLSNSEKLKEELSGEEKKSEGSNETKKKRKLFSRFKAVSTSGIGSSNKNHGKDALSPVENLRRQLKKLEELEDQFPVTTYTDTYMRYPFTDNAQFGSSEIEFFKHRIHLERESVRRAKDSLKSQKKSFENRQKELKQKLIKGEPGSKSVIDQIYQEEKELTDMEVSVYRTRALLGEKIIRLRHLEQSLKRISQPLKKESLAVKGKDFLGRLGVRNQSKEEEKTLSDLSSYSGSSGFSSTDFNCVQNAVGTGTGIKKTSLDQNRHQFQSNMQESSEIIQSLENLNSEIREIWEVLKNHHHRHPGQETISMLPPPPLIYGDLGWSGFALSPPLPFRNTVITSTSNLQRPVAQHFKTQVTRTSNLGQVSTIVDSSLVDRTRSLRDWLKAARSFTPAEGINSSQVTL